MPHKNQYTLPFSWKERRDIIRDVQLDVVNGVSSKMQKSVLKELDSYENNDRGCFASAETIAKNIGCSTAQVKNCFRVLLSQDLILSVSRSRRGSRGAITKERPINWTELAAIAKQSRVSDQRLIADRSTANGHPDQRLMADRSTANGYPDQRLTISHEERRELKEKEPTEQVVVSFLMDLLTEAKLDNPERTLRTAQQMCLGNDQIQERIEAWFALPERQRIPGMLNNWLTRQGSWESDQRTRAREVVKTSSRARENTLQLLQNRQDRKQRQKEYEPGSVPATYKHLSLKGSES